MNKQTDNERLLAEVLTPETEAEFSVNVLTATLRGVQRRRQVRQFRRYGGALAVLLAVTSTTILILQRNMKPELAHAPRLLNYQLVVNLPLTSELVATEPLTSNQSIVSTATIQLVQTVAGGFEEIGDDKLMSLAAPQIVALVRRGPHEAELIFVSTPPEDSDSRPN